jgi:hypothetical protein
MTRKNAYRRLMIKPKGNDHYKELDLGGKIILKFN